MDIKINGKDLYYNGEKIEFNENNKANLVVEGRLYEAERNDEKIKLSPCIRGLDEAREWAKHPESKPKDINIPFNEKEKENEEKTRNEEPEL